MSGCGFHNHGPQNRRNCGGLYSRVVVQKLLDWGQNVFALILSRIRRRYRGLQQFFDWLDQSDHTYDTVKRLTIETDFIHSLPAGVSKFQNLAKLVVSGSRFWDLTCEVVPTSVTHLDLTDHSNLQPKCIKGMDRLVNLCELKLDWTPFGFNGLFFGRKLM